MWFSRLSDGTAPHLAIRAVPPRALGGSPAPDHNVAQGTGGAPDVPARAALHGASGHQEGCAPTTRAPRSRSKPRARPRPPEAALPARLLPELHPQTVGQQKRSFVVSG